jgi:hypothetical protein
MPIGVDKPEQLQWQAAAYRTSKDQFTDMAESYFSIDRTYLDRSAPIKETFIATVTTLTGNLLRGRLFGGSMRTQLLELHIADRDAPLERLLLGITVRRTKLTVEQCPAIRRRMNELPGMSVVLPRRNYLALHPVVHHVIVSVQGAHINAVFTDPAVSAVRWALDTMADLKNCESEAKPQH